MRYAPVRTETDMRAWVLDMLHRQKGGRDLPFVVIHLQSRAPVGVTRYMEFHPQDRNLEIGGTWIGVDFQRTHVNTESKYLLLRHAFEVLGMIRVFLKTDLRNVRSQKAIERLGAVKEGVIRNHIILPDGTIRSSVFYSILAEEWPAMKKKLEVKLYP